jgi:hypothetical protein
MSSPAPAREIGDRAAPEHLKSDALGARGIVLLVVVAAAAPLTVMAGVAPLAILVGGVGGPGRLSCGGRCSDDLRGGFHGDDQAHRRSRRPVMRCLSETAQWLARELAAMPVFEVISDGSAIPVVSFRLTTDPKVKPPYSVFDISTLLRGYGWQVPAYTMPDNATDVAVLRVVVREGFSANLARALRDDLVQVLDKLDTLDGRGLATDRQFAH